MKEEEGRTADIVEEEKGEGGEFSRRREGRKVCSAFGCKLYRIIVHVYARLV